MTNDEIRQGGRRKKLSKKEIQRYCGGGWVFFSLWRESGEPQCRYIANRWRQKKTISKISNKERKFDKKKREETLTLSLVRSDDMQTLSLYFRYRFLWLPTCNYSRWKWLICILMATGCWNSSSSDRSPFSRTIWHSGLPTRVQSTW